MTKTLLKAALGAFAGTLIASAATAAPISLNSAQMDSVAAAGVETIDGFVCPVITTDGVLNSPNGAAIAGGDYTIIGPDVAVPVFATNADGAGAPDGAHAAPGDTSYTAIWAK